MAFGQGPLIDPKKRQRQAQLKKDRFECCEWAKQRAGYDPVSSPAGTAPVPAETRAKALLGAASGALIGGIRRGRQERIQQQAPQDRAAVQAGRVHKYNRAFGACMEGRGYTAK